MGLQSNEIKLHEWYGLINNAFWVRTKIVV